MGFFSSGKTSATPVAQNEVIEGLDHKLQPGDHVLRWTNLLLYPIQIHGIVLFAGAGIVTIIDFGLSSGAQGSKEDHIAELDAQVAKRDGRLNIISLTEQKEVEQWKKVNYGESLLSEGKWAKIMSWFRKNEETKLVSNNEDTTITATATTDEALVAETKNKTESLEDQERSKNVMSGGLSNSCEPPVPPPDEIFARQKEAEGLLAWLQQQDEDESKVPGSANLLDEQDRTDSTSEDNSKCCDIPSESEPKRKSLGWGATPHSKSTASTSPRLPKSDPPAIVLSRVRFLLSEDGESTLPPHHLLFANSECIAVWCKTGRFSTIQSQIFLHSTALGNAKTATTVALLVGAQTVTVTSTIPAAGFWGWLGFTTTTSSQVGLLSVNPWLIPVLAGYGIAAVGTPYLILHQAQGKWEKATSELNDAFWQRATPDIYVDAIQHWSGLGLSSA